MSRRIEAMRLGYFRHFPQPALTLMRGWDQYVNLPIIMFAVVGSGPPVIVDTGTSGPEDAMRDHGYELVRPFEEQPAHALAAIGIDPTDVEHVVLTHLHWDHSSNNDLFPNARFVVQASEVEYALKPLSPQRVVYESGNGMRPRWLDQIDRFLIIEGDFALSADLDIIHLPGHSPGSQGLAVRIGTGGYLIAGDCVDTYENFKGDAHSSHIPTGAYTSLFDYMTSFERIDQLGLEVIPSHDQRVVDRGVFK